MEVVVDLSAGGVSLRHRDDVMRFAVRAIPQHAGEGEDEGALGPLAAALSLHDAGRVDSTGTVFVPPIAVRQLATEAAAGEGRALDPGWEAGFAGMLEYATGQGWVTDDGSIRAHIEWGE